MKKRPTIPDLATAADVSLSTVNRVINDPNSVRQKTRERVLQAAADIGFYGLGSIEHAVKRGRRKHRLGILLQQGHRHFYRDLGEALRRAAADHVDSTVQLSLEYLEELSPENVSARLLAIGERCEAVGLVAAEHPIVSQAIEKLLGSGVPVVGLIAPLSAKGNVSYVGLDNRKVGRTAAWAFDRMCRVPGKIGILIGNHRYRNQEGNESGFRSYFREHNSEFSLLEPLTTYESSAVARELTTKLLQTHPDMCGLFISGGGITGALAALREPHQRKHFITVGYELFDVTRAALIDRTLTMVISHPIEAFARETIATMIRVKEAGTDAGAQSISLGFEIYTSENV